MFPTAGAGALAVTDADSPILFAAFSSDGGKDRFSGVRGDQDGHPTE